MASARSWTPGRQNAWWCYCRAMTTVEQGLTERCPDLVLFDMELLLAEGSHLLELIKRRAPHARVIAWMMYPTSQTAAIGVGADTCILKGAPADEIRQVIVDLLPWAFQHTG
jgi:DNA-binding NarL/FixJ family response regulator